MGLTQEQILSDESHYGSFLCNICTNLVELSQALVTEPCSHTFCRRCLESWFEITDEDDPNVWIRHSHNRPNRSVRRDRLRCPTCNASLLRNGPSHSDGGRSSCTGKLMVTKCAAVQLLEDYEPLAFRVLKKVRVNCPLSKVCGCSWKGDYGDLQVHLNSDSAHQHSNEMDSHSKNSEVEGLKCDGSSDERSKALMVAGSFKDEGNAKFSAGNYRDAIELYSKALSMINSDRNRMEDHRDNIENIQKHTAATLFANRAAAHLSLRQYELCVNDCNEALSIDSSYVKAYVRRAKAQADCMGKFEEAYTGLMTGIDTSSTMASKLSKEFKRIATLRDQMRKGIRHFEDEDFADAARVFGNLLKKTPKALPVIVFAARSEVYLGLTDRALRLSLQIIREDKMFAEAYEVHALCMFMDGEFENSIIFFRESLRLDPDLNGAKRSLKKCVTTHASIKEARKYSFHRQFSLAVTAYETIFEQSPTLPVKSKLFGILHTEKAEAHLRLKEYDKSLRHCARALYGQDDNERAWILKVQAYHGLGRDEDALEELAPLMEIWGSSSTSICKAYEKAEFEVRKRSRPDYYSLLRVPRIASTIEIKKQYKIRAKDLHPDRYSGIKFTDKDRKRAEEQFKLLGEALEILCDDFKRQLYDEGYDRSAIQERMAAAEQAAHRSQGGYHHGGYHR